MFYKALQKKKNNKKAFTLIELIVVIAIIGVLVAILVPTMTGFVNDARQSTANANARTIYSIAQAQITFAQTNGESIAAAYDESSEDTVGADILAQIGSLADGATYDITVDTDTGSVTGVTYTGADGVDGVYPPS